MAPLNSLMTLLALHVGAAAEVPTSGTSEWWDKPWRSGFIKESQPGAVSLGFTGLAGDEQADLVHHGGPDKALCVYPAEHYPFWNETLHPVTFPWGSFGENLTTQGLIENEICIGDIFTLPRGTVVQVSQPRQPCWKLARRWRIKDFALQLEQTGRTGWYFRVLKPGSLSAGDTLRLTQRPHPDWTISRANALMHHQRDNRTDAAELARCPALSKSWQQTLSARSQGDAPSPTRRLEQP